MKQPPYARDLAPHARDLVQPMLESDSQMLARAGLDPEKYVQIEGPLLLVPEAGLVPQMAMVPGVPGARMVWLPVLLAEGALEAIRPASRLSLIPEAGIERDVQAFATHALPRVLFYVDREHAGKEAVAVFDAMKLSKDIATSREEDV